MTTDQTTSIPRLEANDGVRIPQLGFGVFKVPPPQTAETVLFALRTGYRSIDTAAAYHNEAQVGEALRRSGLQREEVFLTTKLWNDEQGYSSTLNAFGRSLERLGCQYLDLYLIHWPAPGRGRYVETWKAFCQLREQGRARSIGVSNFTVENLERIIDATGVAPALNQIELHPWLSQGELRRYHAEHGILTEAWSPLARGEIVREPVIEEIAAARERTPAQVVLRWHVQLSNIVIPKSVTPSRIEENFRIFDFRLSDEEMRAIDQLDRGRRTGPDPVTFA